MVLLEIVHTSKIKMHYCGWGYEMICGLFWGLIHRTDCDFSNAPIYRNHTISNIRKIYTSGRKWSHSEPLKASRVSSSLGKSHQSTIRKKPANSLREEIPRQKAVRALTLSSKGLSHVERGNPLSSLLNLRIAILRYSKFQTAYLLPINPSQNRSLRMLKDTTISLLFCKSNPRKGISSLSRKIMLCFSSLFKNRRLAVVSWRHQGKLKRSLSLKHQTFNLQINSLFIPLLALNIRAALLILFLIVTIASTPTR